MTTARYDLPDIAGAAHRLPNPQTTAALGSWTFRNRSWLPVPLALVLALSTAGRFESSWMWGSGIASIAVGIAIRMWAVRNIGVISRTRAARVGPLVTTGPYALVRNPLYVGNLLLWTGLVLCSELAWMLPVAWIVFAFQYGAIVRWEEQLLREKHSDGYQDYCAAVARWRPRRGALTRFDLGPQHHSWRAVLFSERGALVAVLVMMCLLLAKQFA